MSTMGKSDKRQSDFGSSYNSYINRALDKALRKQALDESTFKTYYHSKTRVQPQKHASILKSPNHKRTSLAKSIRFSDDNN